MSTPSVFFRHVALSVPDLDASVRWYSQMFGFRELSREYAAPPRSMIATLGLGELEIELFQHDETRAMSPERSDPDLDPQTQGIKHFCLGTEDLEGLVASLREKQADIVLGPVRMGNNTLYYIRDNSGNLVELMQRD